MAVVALADEGGEPHSRAPDYGHPALPSAYPAARRPASSTIATTPLEKLPPAFVIEAERLLEADHQEAEAWLADACVQVALWQQGVELEDVRSARRRSAHATGPELRYMQQLLAQVLWESELCQIADEEARQAERSAGVEVPGSLEVPLTALASTRPLSPTVASPGKAVALRPPSEPPPKPSRRPISGGELRRCAMQARGQSIAEEKLQDRAQRWNDKENTLLEARQLRLKRMEYVRERARQRNAQKELQRVALAQDRERRQAQLYQDQEKADQDLQQKVAKSRTIHQNVADMLCTASAARWGVLQANRHRILKERQERRRAETERAEKAQEDADVRRQHVLRARSAGPPVLRAVREVVRRQAARVERIREVERESLRQRIENRALASPKGHAMQPGASLGHAIIASGTPMLHMDGEPPGMRPVPPKAEPPTSRRPVAWCSWSSKAGAQAGVEQHAANDDSSDGHQEFACLPDRGAPCDEPEAESALGDASAVRQEGEW
eukprot:CAMPEP_0168386262 /NCGR_PEP_ID=MMETSP0228-20121227/15337_1 /TAXON_ID=133427 /ORGANISM="Protoceratium reticulatum, Strain CCCM 535 (=CCMP 1889)" /LENGTH=498 /DNA_ID=CAMNT_0008399457 /DNA_START=9 /DNA_END=1502 /DNA_ORIENTATION=-